MASRTSILVRPAERFGGRLRVPGDKSIAHRFALLAALASGRSVVRNFAPGADCQATRACLEGLGVRAEGDTASLTIIGRGPCGFSSPAGPLDARNSGTTTRLLAGLLAAHPFESTITGDESLQRRPMRRVIAPLQRMGAAITSTDGRLPMTIRGGHLKAIDHTTEVPSAQVKSAVLLAGLHARGTTRITESHATRNHTEAAFTRFGIDVRTDGLTVSVEGGQAPRPVDATVPGDLSSAAFWMCAAAAVPGGDVTIEQVGLNPSRTALLSILGRTGATVEAMVEAEDGGEPVGCVRVRHAGLQPLTIAPAEVPGVIDELPVLAALATHRGELTVTGASELRVKESDRIAALVAGLRALGADADELPDGFHVAGTRRLTGGEADAVGDHRLAMAFAVAALGADGPSTIHGAEAVDVSYPGFFGILASLAG
jgi:3-phosphoshikimate 1-carboxyvinyltransferase